MLQEYPDYKYQPRKKMKGAVPGCPGLASPGPLSPHGPAHGHAHHKQPKTRPGCLKPRLYLDSRYVDLDLEYVSRFGLSRPAGVRGENNNMTGTSTILHQKTVMTTGVQVNIPLPPLCSLCD